MKVFMKILQQKLGPSFVSSLILGIVLGFGAAFHPQLVKAQSMDNAPEELLDLIKDIDRAANRQKIDNVMDFYSEDFTNSDGLNRASLEEALSQFWELYPILRYRTEVTSWERDGDAIIAETVTYVTGVRRMEDRNMNLTATIRAKQRYENQKIVEQEILAERNQQTLGEKPPTVELSVPEEVFVGEQYNFDAIVVEPLGDEMMIGVAVEEPVSDEAYFQPASFKLEELRSGGIFKIGIAPIKPESRWLSTIFMRQDGITINTNRLRVVEPGASQ
jgi:ketosteroid isomerase-like protein